MSAHPQLPYLPPFPPRDLNDLIMLIYTGLCHQIAERSFHWGNYQFPICARDTGTYLGFLLTHLLMRRIPFLKEKFKALMRNSVLLWGMMLLALLFFAYDGLTSYMKLRETSNFIRLATGLGVGIHLGGIIASFRLFIDEGLEVSLWDKSALRDAILAELLMILLGGLPLFTLGLGKLVGFWYITLVVGIPYVLLSYNQLIARVIIGSFPDLRRKNLWIWVISLSLLILELGLTAMMKIYGVLKLKSLMKR